MRSVSTGNGYAIIVSNQEYRLIRNISARGKVSTESLDEFHCELADKLYSRGLLNKVQDGDEEFYTPVNKEK